MDRPIDIVLLGATGFTGALTAARLAEGLPAGGRLALAGRSRDRLAAVRERLGLADVELVEVDATDPAGLLALARRTRVLATTVGPYVLHGDPVVAACADAGTDYLDLTGEPEFVDRTWLRHHARALETGARLVHSCGFDAVPHDLGVQLCVDQLPEGVPLRVQGYVRVSARPSGGTTASVLTALSRGRQNLAAARERRAAEPRPVGRRVHTPAMAPHRDPTGDGWAVPAPLIDQQVVARSAAALERYGPDFTYAHLLSLPRVSGVVAAVSGVAGLAVAAQVPPLRRWVAGRLPAGEGPSAQRRAESWFRGRYLGVGGGQRVVVEVTGGDPGYDETSVMLAQAALCLAFDELPSTAGQVTTAVAMGPVLRSRLVAAGIGFEVVEAGADRG